MKGLNLYQPHRSSIEQVPNTKRHQRIFSGCSCYISRGTLSEEGDGKETASNEPACPTASATKQSTLGKRRPRRDEFGGNEAEDETGRVCKRGKAQSEQEDSRTVLFACPFRKHDPQTYAIFGRYRHCAIAKLPSVSRVKYVPYFQLCFNERRLLEHREHIFRRHLPTIHCAKCFRVFNSSKDLDDHMILQGQNTCDVENRSPPPKGISAEQEKALRSRKKTGASQSEEDRWKEIYQVLFPGEPCPKSPCMISTFCCRTNAFSSIITDTDIDFEEVQDESRPPGLIDVNQFSVYAQRNFPTLLRSMLEQTATEPYDGTLEVLVSSVAQCVDTLLRDYPLQTTTEDGTSPEQVINSQAKVEDLRSTSSGVSSHTMTPADASQEISPTHTEPPWLMLPTLESNEIIEMPLETLPVVPKPSELDESDVGRQMEIPNWDLLQQSWEEWSDY